MWIKWVLYLCLVRHGPGRSSSCSSMPYLTQSSASDFRWQCIPTMRRVVWLFLEPTLARTDGCGEPRGSWTLSGSQLRISWSHRMHQRFKLKPSRYHSTVNGIRVVFTTRPNPSRATRYSIQMYTRIPPTLAVATLQPKVKLKHSFWLRLWGDNCFVGNICQMLEVIALCPAPAYWPRCTVTIFQSAITTPRQR